MALLENIMLALSGLKTSKMRSFLTMLGIIIGIGSVIAIITVGDSMTGSVTSMMNDMGANSIQIGLSSKMDENGNYYQGDIEESDYISEDMLTQYVERFGDQLQGLSVTTGAGNSEIKNGTGKASVSITGTNADHINTTNLKMLSGHYLSEREVQSERYAAVISDKAAEKLFGSQTPLGKEVKMTLNGQLCTFTVVGVYKYEVSSMMSMMSGEMPTTVYVPYGLVQKLMDYTPGYNYMQIRAKTGVDLDQLGQQSADFFNRFYRNNQHYEIIYQSLESVIAQMNDMMGTMKIAISIIAAISLLVGGIGVMNIMLVSVTERTREIGTRKALGATNSSIQMQFIVEAMIICLIGGAIGILLGLALGYGGSALLGFPAKPSIGTIALAVGFSMLIGVFFGYYPASKAAKMDPIEALRYE